jgi:hypothetical protein
MSRDRVTITRAEAIRRRREEEEKRRDKDTRQRVIKPKPASTQAKTERPTLSLTPASTDRLRRRRYDIAMSAPHGRSIPRGGGRTIQLPEINLPRLSYGPRWLSFLLMSACLLLIYGMSTSDSYLVKQVVITGNQRIQANEMEMVIGIWNQPSFVINPAQVQHNLLVSYPELYSVEVYVGLPAEISIRVQERIPAIAWEQAGQVVWVDAQGYSFPPRGAANDMTIVTALGLPPVPPNFDPGQTIGARPFMTPELARTITTLSPIIPEGASLVYDPQYGLGWQDPFGWQVYFGNSSANLPVQLKVYMTMVDYLVQRNIQPALISVEYPSAPFYRLAED